MLKRFFIFILFSSLFSIEKENIIDVLESYSKAFGDADYSKIVSFFDYPVSFNLQNKTIKASSRFKLKLIYKKMRSELPDYYSYSKFDKINIQVIDSNIALVNAGLSRYKSDGSVFFQSSMQYYLRLKDNEWKIFSLTPYTDIKILN